MRGLQIVMFGKLGREAAALLLLLATFSAAPPATAAGARLVQRAIDETRLATLSQTRPRGALGAQDAGAIADDTALDGVHVVLRRTAASQAALDALTAAQLEPASPAYHHWLSAAELGVEFGPDPADIAAVSAWLSSHGLHVDSVAPTGMSITASGTAAQFSAAFHTVLHHMVGADGRTHIAPTADLAVPAALAGIVQGATLSDYFPHPVVHPAGAVQRRRGGGWTMAAPAFTVTDSGDTFYAVAPADFATIYNVTPVRSGTALGTALTGAGVGIAVLEDTDILASDWSTFRNAFGLSGFTGGTLTTLHPAGCSDPGRNADEIEGALDAEWASAVAPNAAITLASCTNTATTFGVLTALQGLVEQGTRAAVISVSYGGCEAENGMAFQQQWTNLVQEGAAEGLSIFVAAGDSAAAACDSGSSSRAKGGLAVNGLASSAYDTAIGGTDFLDAAEGQIAAYWSSGNSGSDASALSYVPEIPWNDSCASSVIDQYLGAADPIAACNTRSLSGLLDVVGGGGGASVLYAKPSWQRATGLPANTMRDLPDASLFAADGVWGHFYVYCMSDRAEGGTPCSFGNGADVLASGAGGTSFGAPSFAGIQALIVQRKAGIRQGNAAARLYALAQSWTSYFGQSQCRASLGRATGASCIFHTVDIGTTAVPCAAGTENCYVNSESTQGLGVLSSASGSDSPAYPASQSWSYANGLGSVNVTNLVGSY
jgi:subtilase family serine protease